jgi:hypothetical protein
MQTDGGCKRYDAHGLYLFWIGKGFTVLRIGDQEQGV